MANFIKIFKTIFLIVIIFSLLLTFTYSAPPPSCTIQSAGCYKTGDAKVGFNELKPDEFGYFLLEDKCIKTGTCDCKGRSEGVTPQTNPDDSSGACNCIAAAEWNANGKCCGDDTDDCGKLSSGSICSIDSKREASAWISSETNFGDIRYAGCSNIEYLSDGNSWIRCDGAFWKNTVRNNEYICISKARESIIECCGDKSCNSKSDGKRLATGQFMNLGQLNATAPRQECKTIEKTNCPSLQCGGEVFTQEQCTPVLDTKTYNVGCSSWGFKYKECPQESNIKSVSVVKQKSKSACTLGTSYGYNSNVLWVDDGCRATFSVTVIGENKTFNCKKEVCKNITTPVISLDNKTYYCNADGKFITDLDNSKSACEKAGFKWTGSKCCGEPEDTPEYYNDASGIGGCWDSKAVISVSFVNGTNDSAVNYNGEFHGCAIDKTNFNKANDNLLSIKDRHTQQALVTNHDYCFNDPEKNYYCSYTEKWLSTNGADKPHLSDTPFVNTTINTTLAECCAQNQCWNGISCANSQKSEPLSKPIGDGFRCIDGDWIKSNLKFTPDGSLSGYCSKESQCLVDPFAKNKSSCIESGQYIKDDYCEDGNWSSRTKLLALKMIKLKSGDYTLFCDNRKNTLNNLNYLVGSDQLASDILIDLDANNFCVLSSKGIVIAGTTINRDIDNITGSK